MLYRPEQLHTERYATNWEVFVTLIQIGIGPLVVIGALSYIGTVNDNTRSLPIMTWTPRAIIKTMTPTPELTPELTWEPTEEIKR